MEININQMNFPLNFEDIRALTNFEIQLKKENLKCWEDFEKETDYLPICYSDAYANFNLEFQKYHGGKWIDYSIIFTTQNKTIAIWPLSISFKNNLYNLSSFRVPLLPPIFSNSASRRNKKNVVYDVNKIIKFIINKLNIRDNSLQSYVPFLNTPSLPLWFSMQTSQVHELRVEYDLFLAIEANLDEIKKNFRKSYKPLINSAMNEWKSFKLTEYDKNIWSEFKKLHLEAAGRITRSEETWEIQHNLIKKNKAFLTYLRDDKNKMVACGFYWHTKSECEYGVGAFDRSLFDKPIGHLVQYVAIEEMIKRKIKWYRVGRKANKNNLPIPDKKEEHISLFKQGFSSHTMPVYFLTNKINELQSS